MLFLLTSSTIFAQVKSLFETMDEVTQGLTVEYSLALILDQCWRRN